MLVNSMLDQDLYKFSMGRAVFDRYFDARVRYKFIDRRCSEYNSAFLAEFKDGVKQLAERQLTHAEAFWLREKCPWLGMRYIDWLKSYRFNPNELDYRIDEEGCFHLSIQGQWGRAIYWEVPLMALISECYFRTVEPNTDYNTLDADVSKKRAVLESRQGLRFADFGTRRRRSYETQLSVIEGLRDSPNFIGTSNTHFAESFDLKPIGTCAHEWFMAISALENLRFANRAALTIWNEIFQGNNGVALTDTFGTIAFLDDFDYTLANLYDGVRHDSGDPFVFINRIVNRYRSLGINPMSKSIVFSDGLTVDKAVEIYDACAGRIGCSFGIGTHFTNDFKESPSLNIVVKLDSVDGFNVVKLSDEPSKACGHPKAVAAAKFIHRL